MPLAAAEVAMSRSDLSTVQIVMTIYLGIFCQFNLILNLKIKEIVIQNRHNFTSFPFREEQKD
jgi:hypothetical protein